MFIISYYFIFTFIFIYFYLFLIIFLGRNWYIVYAMRPMTQYNFSLAFRSSYCYNYNNNQRSEYNNQVLFLFYGISRYRGKNHVTTKDDDEMLPSS